MVTRRKATDGFGTFTKITFRGDDGEAFIKHLKATSPEKRIERLEAYIARCVVPDEDLIAVKHMENLRKKVEHAKARYDFAKIKEAEAAWRELGIYLVHMPRARQGAKQSVTNRKNAQQPRGKIEIDYHGKIAMTSIKKVAKSFFVDDAPPQDLWPHFVSKLEEMNLALEEQTDTKGAKFFNYTKGEKLKTFKFHTFETYLSEEKTKRRKRK